jgi:CubicO group peptidase (beta-lactamase class C family)
MARWEELDAFVRDRMTRTRLPGVSLGIVRGNGLVYARGYGFRDLGARLPATPHTRYGIGSITKSFTALAIMQLAEEGKLSLDDPVERFLPLELRPGGEPIRIWHLLTHTSGLPALAYAEALIRWEQDTGGKLLPLATVDDFVAWLNGAEDWLEARPGERWFYLNEGYVLLGGIIERASGLPYDRYIRERIFAPLGMEESGFLGEELGELAVPYVIPAQGAPRPGRAMPIPIGSDGAIVSSVVDLAKYVSLYLRQGVPLISPDSYAEMVTPRISYPHQPAPFATGQGKYAYGLAVQELLGRTLIGHGGSVLVYTAHLAFLPEEGVGVAVLANGSGYPMGQLAQVALACALGEDWEELPFVRWERLGERIYGTYETYRGAMQAVVRPAGGAVELELVDKEAPTKVLLMIEDFDAEEARFIAPLGDRRLPVEFRLFGDRTELIYERYKLRRISPLT